MKLNSSKFAELLNRESLSSYISRKNTELSLTHKYKLVNDLGMKPCRVSTDICRIPTNTGNSEKLTGMPQTQASLRFFEKLRLTPASLFF